MTRTVETPEVVRTVLAQTRRTWSPREEAVNLRDEDTLSGEGLRDDDWKNLPPV